LSICARPKLDPNPNLNPKPKPDPDPDANPNHNLTLILTVAKSRSAFCKLRRLTHFAQLKLYFRVARPPLCLSVGACVLKV